LKNSLKEVTFSYLSCWIWRNNRTRFFRL